MALGRKRKSDDSFAGLRKGVLELLVLNLIAREPLYAADILKRLEHAGFKSAAGTLYPLLGRMRRAGFIEHEWKESHAGPPRKYYTLARVGAQRLEALSAFWARISNALKTD